tara:strand:- start:741 stop:875 length:135 start_codon:yes stop_codon:yes gene_type:complete
MNIQEFEKWKRAHPIWQRSDLKTKKLRLKKLTKTIKLLEGFLNE